MPEILRPMSTGELMDRTLGLYKKNFKLFIGIASLGPICNLIFQLLNINSASIQAGTPRQVNPFSAASVGVGFFAGFLIMLAGIAIAHAATVRAVAAVHLGLPITIFEAYKSLKGRIGRILGVFFSMMLMAMLAAFVAILLIVVVALILRIFFEGATAVAPGRQASLVFGFIGFGTILIVLIFAAIVWVRYALAIACCIVEDLGVIKSLKRSAALSRGSRFRIFLIYAVFLILAVLFSAALGAIAGGFGHFISYVPGRLILIYLAGFIAGALTGPLATIGIALAYYDERVRKEAFDLQVMMGSLDAAPSFPTAAPIQP